MCTMYNCIDDVGSEILIRVTLHEVEKTLKVRLLCMFLINGPQCIVESSGYTRGIANYPVQLICTQILLPNYIWNSAIILFAAASTAWSHLVVEAWQ